MKPDTRQRKRDERDLVILDRLRRRHTPADIARDLGITPRWVNATARQIIAEDSAQDPEARPYWRTLKCYVSLA